MKTTPEFCRKCGNKLTYSKSPDGFDGDTGEPLYEEKLVCPRRGRILGFLFTDSHENYENYHGWGWSSHRYSGMS